MLLKWLMVLYYYSIYYILISLVLFLFHLSYLDKFGIVLIFFVIINELKVFYYCHCSLKYGLIVVVIA